MKHLFFIFILSTFLYSDNLKPISVQLKWKHQFQFAGFYMAKELGFYKDVGLDVELKEFKTGMDILNEIENKKSDLGIDDSSLIYHKLNGANIVALFPISQTSAITLISQENLNSIKYLENKNIEFSSNELTNISIKAILKSHDVNINQIYHSYGVEDFIAKKSDGMVGYASNQPFYLNEKNIKYNIFNPKDFGFDFYGDIIFSSKEFASNNPKIVSDFLKATKKGWEYAFSNIPQTVDFILTNYNTQNKSKESLLFEAQELKKLSGLPKNFGEFDIKRVENIMNILSFLFPQKYQNTNLDDFIWNEKEELTKYYKNHLKPQNEFTVCVQDNIFPIDGIEDGKLSGISGDILNKIAEQFNLKLKPIQSENFKKHYEKVLKQECDILTITAEDAYKQFKVIDRTNFYLESNLVIITKIDKPFMEDHHFLENKKFITKYKVFKDYLTNLYPGINVSVDNDIENAINALEKEEIDGFIVDNITVDRIIQKYGYGKFKISGFLGNEQPIRGAFGVLKSKPELLEILNLGIDSFDKNELGQLKEKWKVTRYTTVQDYTLVWKIITIFVFILILITIFVVILRKHNKELNEWLNSTIEGIGIFEDGKLIKANKQLVNIFGYENFDEINKKTYSDFLVPESFEIIKNRLNENTEPYELVFRKKDGTLFDGLVKGFIIKGTNKRISTIIDITEMKQSKRELKELNTNLEEKIKKEIEKNKENQTIIFQQSKFAEMGLMLSMIAHQWRQPLNNISLIVNTIIIKQKKEHLTIDSLEKLKNDFQHQINYLSNTIDDFQNFFKPKKDKEYFYIKELILNTYSLTKPIFEQNNININVNIEDDIKYFGYRNELAQVILNILNNSKDALIENNISNKNLNIFLTNTQKDLIITIQDNAKGVNEWQLEKIFEPYFSTKIEKNGTGLGLYVSKIIINHHFDGDIFAKNIKDGFEIIISLPNIDL